MLKLGVLNLTLKLSPDPNMSLIDPTFSDICTGSLTGTVEGAGVRTALLNVDVPDTAEDTV